MLSCDVLCDYTLSQLPAHHPKLAHIVLVNNPVFHPRGDFYLKQNKLFLEPQQSDDQAYTFANIGVYHPALFSGYKPGKFRLGDVLKKAIIQEQVTGEHFSGFWHNVGTPDELEKAAISTLHHSVFQTQ